MGYSTTPVCARESREVRPRKDGGRLEELPPPPKLRRIDPVRERLKELATEGAAEGAEDGDPSPER